jgi:hypothetical protein
MNALDTIEQGTTKSVNGRISTPGFSGELARTPMK